MLYLDASALVKLVLPESESELLRLFLGKETSLSSSDLSKVELLRAVARVDEGVETRARALAVLDGVTLVRIDEAVIEDAAALEPPSLRSLDAIHLATALLLADGLEGFVTYDTRLAIAADKLGLPVMAPGSE